MINHHTILRDDLKRINNNINKKYTTLRKEVAKTMEVFENEQIPVFPYEVCFGLFRQISDAASLTASLAFFPFLQNIINLGFANAEMSRQILTLLHVTKSIPKFQSFENETRLQTIIALLVSKNCIDLKQLRFTHSLFNLVLGLQNTRYRSLWVKSCTILSQTTLLLANQIRDEPTQQKIAIFQGFLCDLCKIVRAEKVQWLLEFSDLYIILQVFSEILDQKYFQESSKAHHETLGSLIPTILTQYRKTIQFSLLSLQRQQPYSSSKSWELSAQNRLLILTRVGCKINIVSKTGFELIEEIIKLISEKRVHALKIIGYEGINYLFRHITWFHDLLNSNFAELFNFFLTTEFNIVKLLLSEHKEKADLSVYFSSQDTQFSKIMGMNAIELGFHEFTVSHELKIIIKNLQEITYGLYVIYGQIYKIDLNEKIEGKPPLQKTYKFCLKTVFQTIKALFNKEMSEDTLQSLLKISQKFINISGCFNDPSSSAVYIKLMCKYCLPGEFRTIGHRHIQINKMILNTANCLGHLFTSSCWVIVWKALQNYSIYYNRYLLGKEQLQTKARESDIQILYTSMDSIFTETPKYDGKYLLEVIRSLTEVAYECLQNNYNDESRKIFAFQRIEQIYKLNLGRIHIIWPELSSSLLCITTSKVLYFRVSALNLLNTLIPLSLNYLKGHSESIQLPFNDNNYEGLILEPWMNLVSCQFQQIKDELMIAVNKLIIDYGHIMTNGWRCILSIVKSTNDLKSLQAIVETFLQKVHDNLMDILTVVDNVERTLTDTNQKFLCLTMIWAIGDYAHKNKESRVLKKIYQILLVPEEMFDLGTEARQSSFYIFAEILVHNCAEKDQEFWVWIFSQIKKFYSYGIRECLKAKDKQYAEEAVKNLLTNLIKIYKKFFLVGKEWENKESIDLILGDFYVFCGEILQFRSPEIYQNLLKQIKEIFSPKMEESLKIESFYKFIQALTQIYYVEDDNKILKCLITYLPADIFDLLGKSLSGLDKNFLTIYKLTEKIFLLRLEALQKEIKLHKLRIFFEQKYYFELLKKIHNYILEEKPQLVPIYMESSIKTLMKLKLYEDYPTIAKSLPYLTSTHLKFPQINWEMTLGLLEELIGTRIQQSWIKNYGNGKDIPIWYIGSQDLLKISYEYLRRGMNSSIKSYQILQNTLKCPEVEEKVTNNFTEEYQCHHYENQITICNFLVQNYFFSSNEELLKDISPEDLVTIAQTIKKRSELIASSDPTKKGLNAYSMLFKVSEKLQITTTPRILENQAIFVEYLFERIFHTLDQIKNLSNEENLILELRFALKKMLNLELQEGILKIIEEKLMKKYLQQIKIEAQVLQLQQAHLFYFQPLLAKCIRCKDDECLQILEQIFSVTGKILLQM